MRVFSNLFLIFFATGCAHMMNHETFQIRLKEIPQAQTYDITIATETQTYEQDELSHRSIRKLSLKIRSLIKQGGTETFWVENTTYEKKGGEQLHYFGLPELSETIRLKLSASGRVLDVPGYDKMSIFYLPPVLFPSHPVKIGETWSETFQWRHREQEELIQTEITCALSGFERWRNRDVFKINMTAVSEWVQPLDDITLLNQAEGYFLWDREMGIVVWAESMGKNKIIVKPSGRVIEMLTRYELAHTGAEG